MLGRFGVWKIGRSRAALGFSKLPSDQSERRLPLRHMFMWLVKLKCSAVAHLPASGRPETRWVRRASTGSKVFVTTPVKVIAVSEPSVAFVDAANGVDAGMPTRGFQVVVAARNDQHILLETAAVVIAGNLSVPTPRFSWHV